MNIKKMVVFVLFLFVGINCFADTNVVVDNMLNRKSVRKYSNKPVEQDKIDLIVKSAMSAPSAKNLQPWEFLVVTDKNLLKQIAKYIPNASYSKKSQFAIIVCGDKNVSEKFWIQDCSAVTENILLVVESLDLGAVWCAVYPYEDKVEKIQKLFKLPDNIVPLNVIPVGYPKKKETPKQKYNPKKVHTNSWE